MSYTWKDKRKGTEDEKEEHSIYRHYDDYSQRMQSYFAMSYKKGDQAFLKWEKYVAQKGIYRAINRLREWPRAFGTMHSYYVWGLFKSRHYYTRGQGIKNACGLAEKWHEARNKFETCRYKKEQKEQYLQREKKRIESLEEGERVRQRQMQKIQEISRCKGFERTKETAVRER